MYNLNEYYFDKIDNADRAENIGAVKQWLKYVGE